METVKSQRITKYKIKSRYKSIGKIIEKKRRNTAKIV